MNNSMKCKCGEDYSDLANLQDMNKVFWCRECSRKYRVEMDEDSSCGEFMYFWLEEIEFGMDDD